MIFLGQQYLLQVKKWGRILPCKNNQSDCDESWLWHDIEWPEGITKLLCLQGICGDWHDIVCLLHIIQLLTEFDPMSNYVGWFSHSLVCDLLPEKVLMLDSQDAKFVLSSFSIGRLLPIWVFHDVDFFVVVEMSYGSLMCSTRQSNNLD